MEKTYSVSELAFIFGKTHATIYNWMGEKLPKDRDVTVEDVRQLLEKQQTEAQAEMDAKWRRFRDVKRGEGAPIASPS